MCMSSCGCFETGLESQCSTPVLVCFKVDVCTLHCPNCKRVPRRSAGHHALNDLVARGFAVPVTIGLFLSDAKTYHTGPMAEWQVLKLGSHDNSSIGWKSRWSRPSGRCGGKLAASRKEGSMQIKLLNNLSRRSLPIQARLERGNTQTQTTQYDDV